MDTHGKLVFNYGTMSSGKSLRLLSVAHNLQESSLPFLIFKSSIDTRDGVDKIHSRALLEERECVSVSPTDDLFTAMEEYKRMSEENEIEMPRMILVDEAQFLTAKQVDELAAVADRMGLDVICYGLRTDFQTHLFEGSKRLFEIADRLEEIPSSCTCGSKTLFNARINEKKEIITDGAQVEVGGNDKYKAYCRRCFFEKTNNPLYTKIKE